MRYSRNICILTFAVLFILCSQGVVHSGLFNKNKVVREYYRNGKPRLENHFKKGLLIRSRTFHENGRLATEHRYDNRGQLYFYRKFYDNGKLKSVWTRKSNITKFYTRKGKLKYILDPNKKKKYRSSYIFSSPK